MPVILKPFSHERSFTTHADHVNVETLFKRISVQESKHEPGSTLLSFREPMRFGHIASNLVTGRNARIGKKNYIFWVVLTF